MLHVGFKAACACYARDWDLTFRGNVNLPFGIRNKQPSHQDKEHRGYEPHRAFPQFDANKLKDCCALFA